MLELLEDGLDFESITIAQKLDQDDLTKRIVSAARSKGVKVEEIPYHKMTKGRSGEKREVIVAYLHPTKNLSLAGLLEDLQASNQEPFFLLLSKVGFANNIGVITRTAYAAGVNGIIYQGEKDKVFNEDTLHYSLGHIAKIPFVKMNIFEAINELRKSGVKTFALHMEGKPYFAQDLSGASAFVLGAEREGVSEKVLDRCDETIAIPMRKGSESLNVSASASIVIYEKMRQEAVKV